MTDFSTIYDAVGKETEPTKVFKKNKRIDDNGTEIRLYYCEYEEELEPAPPDYELPRVPRHVHMFRR